MAECSASCGLLYLACFCGHLWMATGAARCHTPAVGKYRIVRQADGSYDIVAAKPNGRLIVPGFKTQDDARIWIATIEPDERSERREPE